MKKKYVQINDGEYIDILPANSPLLSEIFENYETGDELHITIIEMSEDEYNALPEN